MGRPSQRILAEETWRDDHGTRGRRRSLRHRPPRRRISTSIFLPDLLSSRIIRQILIAGVILVVLAAAMQLPYGMGESVHGAIATVLQTNTEVEQVVATVRQLSEEGGDWSLTDFAGEDGILPVTLVDEELADEPAGPEHWIWPAEGEVVTPFGWLEDEDGDEARFHSGIDILIEEDDVAAVAAAAGTVRSVANHPGATGFLVEIEHSGGWSTRYVPLAGVTVDEGDTVQQGDTLGQVERLDPDHWPVLYFEMLRDGTQVDPEPKLHRQQAGA